MFFWVFSGNEIRNFFEEKWEMLKKNKLLRYKLSTTNLFCVIAKVIKE